MELATNLIDQGSIHLVWVLVCAVLVMLMQAGFCCLETGLVRAKNSINVAIKNLVDFCISSIIFWAFGFAIMFGLSYHGVVGTSGFFFGQGASSSLYAFFLFQVVFCGTATTIISGAVAERMRFGGYIAVSIVVSGLIYPFIGHWVWAGADQGIAAGWLNSRGFIDFAGSTVVHSTGGWIALAAVLVIGPRQGRFTDKNKPIHGHNLSLATLGVLLLWFGWFGFNGGSTLAFCDEVPMILVNTNLSAAFGGLTALALSWTVTRSAKVEHVINGVIAGLVGITASCHIMTPVASALIGTGAGTICLGSMYLMDRLKIDDVVGAVPAHACAGVWGTLAVALFADPSTWGTGLSRWEQLGVQALGCGVCFAWSFGVGFIAIALINRWIPLRAKPEDEKIGLNIAEHGASTETYDLLMMMENQRQDSDFSRPVIVEPHTEVGQIAMQYNRVIEKVNEETQKLMTANAEIHDMNQEITLSRDQEIAARRELQDKVEQLERFNRVAVGRELTMIDLKRQINDLASTLGHPPTYDLSFDHQPTQDAGEHI